MKTNRTAICVRRGSDTLAATAAKKTAGTAAPAKAKKAKAKRRTAPKKTLVVVESPAKAKTIEEAYNVLVTK